MQGRFKHTDRLVLIFVIFGFLLLVAFSALVLIKNKTFTNRLYYITFLDSASGLSSNPPIFFKGLPIGRIEDFELVSDTNEIRVKFYIYEDYTNKIIKYAVISRIENALLGANNEYEILLPKLDSTTQPERLPEGELVPFIQTDLGQAYAKKGQIEQKQNSIDSVLSSVNSVLINLQKESDSETGELFVILQKFSTIADSLVALSHEAETSQIIPEVQKAILDLQSAIASADSTINETKTTIENANRVAQHVDRLLVYYENPAQIISTVTENRIPKTIDNLDALLGNANSAVQHVDRLLVPYENPAQILSTVTENKLPKTIDNVDSNLVYLQNILKEVHLQREQLGIAIISFNRALSTFGKTLEGINNNPLIKDGIENDLETGLSIEINEN
ncbi:MAG: ABC-type transporter Mla subunit MlaD [Gammaproteobacteria bacterium]|jgi:ABC-type transporter Mla subunit MlaD